jgi:hypothetical protein
MLLECLCVFDLQFMPVEYRQFEFCVHRDGALGAGLDALGAVDASVVMKNHLEFFFGFRNLDDFNRFGWAVHDAQFAAVAKLRIVDGRASEILGNFQLFERIFYGGGLFEKVAQKFR